MKRFVRLLLVLSVVAAMLCAFAVNVSAEAGTIPGTTVTWELTENGTELPDGGTGLTLTIGGTGDMLPFIGVDTPMEPRPWKDALGTITTVVVKPGVTAIADLSFKNCISLTSVTIPSSVTGINSSTFAYCTSLKSITIPSSVGWIEGEAFHGCTSLESIVIPASVTSVGPHAFHGCTGLESIVIPSGVTRIDKGAFRDCSNLASVTVKASTPPSMENSVFDSTAGNLAIYVPCGTGADYRQADGWSEYASRIREAYMVYSQPTKNGTVTVDKDCFPASEFVEGQTVAVSVAPAEDFQLGEDGLLITYVDGEEEKAVDLTQDEIDSTKYYFEMPPANVTVKAEFSCVQHTEGDWVVETEATCTTDGKEVQKCKVCGAVIAEKVIPAGHTEGDSETIPATCTTDGKETKKCGICGEVIEEKVIPAPGHSFDITTWSYDGSSHWHPATCGDKDEKDSYGPHSYSGIWSFYCKICGRPRFGGAGSTLSGGDLWIIIAGAVVAVGAVVAAVVIAKKKKKVRS